MTIARRSVLKAAAWSTPVVAAAIAVPAIAASEEPQPTRNRIRFTNATATVGKDPNTIYVNTKVQVIDGPEPVEAVTLTITLGPHKREVRTFPSIRGWGDSGLIEAQFTDVPKGDPAVVTFTAQANGVSEISDTVIVETPGWWS